MNHLKIEHFYASKAIPPLETLPVSYESVWYKTNLWKMQTLLGICDILLPDVTAERERSDRFPF